MSEEGKERLRESNRRRWADPVEREKQIVLRTGVVRSKESIQKGIESRKWYHPSEETKEKQRVGNQKPKPRSPEVIERLKPLNQKLGKQLGLSNIGRHHTEESKTLMSVSKTGEKNHFFGKQHTCESIEKISKSRLGKNTGENNPLWKGGISFVPYCFRFNNRRRKSVRKFFDNYCICCGCHADENISKGTRKILVPKELSVHHILHDKNEGCNGIPFNLVPMCEACHLTERWDEEGFKKHINTALSEGFKWGIWSEQDYIKQVMYSE
jgi:hypothetical protein